MQSTTEERMSVISEIINETLIEWHRWSAFERDGRGYPAKAAGLDTRTSRQYADDSDDLIDKVRMERVDFMIGRMDGIARDYLALNARNLSTGHTVWSSPRLPASATVRAVGLSVARGALYLALKNDKLV